MLNKKNALVLLWTGNPIDVNTINSLKDVLVKDGVTIPELLTIVSKDDEGIAESMIRDNGEYALKIKINNDKNTEDAVNNAVVYIGERFKDSLAVAKKNIGQFTLELCSALQKEKYPWIIEGFIPSPTEHAKALLNAVEIIATKKASIPLSLAKKYNITQKVIDVIIQIYNHMG